MKKHIFKILPFAIFIFAYTLIVFLLVKSYTATFILSYLFVLIATAICFAALMSVGKAINSRYLTYPIFYITLSYTAISLLINTIFVALSSRISYVAPLVTNVIVLAGYSIYFIIHFGVAKHIDKNENETKKQLVFVRIASEIVNNLMRNTADITMLKKIESLYDAIRNSQAIGTASVYDLEYEIINDIGVLEGLFANNNDANIETMINNIKRKLIQRNSKIRMEQNGVR